MAISKPASREMHKSLLNSGQAPSPDQTEADLRDQEADILQLGEKYREEGRAAEMSYLIKQVRPILKNFSKAKAAKLVRGLVDMFLDIDRAEGSKGEAEVQLCQVEYFTAVPRYFKHFRLQN